MKTEEDYDRYLDCANDAKLDAESDRLTEEELNDIEDGREYQKSQLA